MRGRPKKDDSKRNIVRVRFSDDELKMLERAADELDISKSELIRAALFQYYFCHSRQKSGQNQWPFLCQKSGQWPFIFGQEVVHDKK